jgi:hypothetical protein
MWWGVPLAPGHPTIRQCLAALDPPRASGATTVGQDKRFSGLRGQVQGKFAATASGRPPSAVLLVRGADRGGVLAAGAAWDRWLTACGQCWSPRGEGFLERDEPVPEGAAGHWQGVDLYGRPVGGGAVSGGLVVDSDELVTRHGSRQVAGEHSAASALPAAT